MDDHAELALEGIDRLIDKFYEPAYDKARELRKKRKERAGRGGSGTASQDPGQGRASASGSANAQCPNDLVEEPQVDRPESTEAGAPEATSFSRRSDSTRERSSRKASSASDRHDREPRSHPHSSRDNYNDNERRYGEYNLSNSRRESRETDRPRRYRSEAQSSSQSSARDPRNGSRREPVEDLRPSYDPSTSRLTPSLSAPSQGTPPMTDHNRLRRASTAAARYSSSDQARPQRPPRPPRPQPPSARSGYRSEY